MTGELDDNIFLDLFHFTALKAWMEQVAVTGQTPEMEPTRRRAYELYEQMLPEHRAERRRQEDFDSCGESVVTLSVKGELHVA